MIAAPYDSKKPGGILGNGQDFGSIPLTGPSPGAPLGDPNQPPPTMAPPQAAPPAAPSAPAAAPSLYESMQKRMAAVQSGQADPGNVDLYGHNQTLPGAPNGTPPTLPGPMTHAAPGATPTPQSAQQVLTGGGTVGATPAQGSQATVGGAFQQALLNKLAPGDVSAQSAEIQPALQANRLAEQRGFERNRAMQAERNAALGTNMSGGNETELLGLAQDRAQREGQYEAGAVQGLADKQHQAQLMMAQLAGGMFSQQDALAMQKYGIDSGANTSKYGIDTQAKLGGGDLALRDKLGSGQLDLGRAGLASDNAKFGASLNQDALFKMLGMM